ncbi:MAG: NfeD family protein [Cyclobacteriaceae bacterium]|nr:NfeD family protein [Cyclobacteriaceae bacterium]
MFENLDPLLRIFWFVAIPTSLIFLIQTIMTFAGVDATDGLEADFDGDLAHGETPFQLFSLRNLINFLLGFSWTGISFFNTIENKTVLIGLAVLVGAAFVYVFFVIIRQIQKLAEDNSFKIDSTINKTAEVYLAIPERKSGKGKVMVSVKGTFHELDAMTEYEKIPSHAMVRIVKVLNGNILLVETL